MLPRCLFVVTLLAFLALPGWGQFVDVYKRNINMEWSVGGTFSDLPNDQDRWKGGVSSAVSFALGYQQRIAAHWAAGLDLGLYHYSIRNKGPFDNYDLEFMSPYLMASVQHLQHYREDREWFAGMGAGAQWGFQGTFEENFGAYRVEGKGNGPLLYFVRPEIGIRHTIPALSIGNRRTQLSYVISLYYRHNLNRLGSASFVEDDFTVNSSPTGHVIGIIYRLYFPYGRETLQVVYTPPRPKKKWTLFKGKNA